MIPAPDRAPGREMRGSQAVVDLTTEVGQLSESLTVTGEVPLVQTSSAELSGLVGDREIRDLPLNGRSYEALAFLQPGVAQFTSASAGTTAIVANGSGAKMSVAGTPGDFQSFLLDGTDNNAYSTSNQVFSNQVAQPSPDAVAEFKVITSNFSAEYGRVGGAVVNVVMRSGTNQLHGSMYEYLRNTSLNATGFFKPEGGQKPVLQQNQFGATIGGPIRRDKLFFFADYEGSRRVRKLFRGPCPMPLRAGVFARTNGACVIAHQPYLDLIPLPNSRDFGDGTAEFLWEAPATLTRTSIRHAWITSFQGVSHCSVE
jgi:hypothetical protein